MDFDFGLFTLWKRLYNNVQGNLRLLVLVQLDVTQYACRLKIKTECFSEAQFLSFKYNQDHKSTLQYDHILVFFIVRIDISI